jgi:hypothetical protein
MSNLTSSNLPSDVCIFSMTSFSICMRTAFEIVF